MNAINKYLSGDLNVFWPTSIHEELAKEINKDDTFIDSLNYQQKQRLSQIYWTLLDDSESFIKKIFANPEDHNKMPWINQMCFVSSISEDLIKNRLLNGNETIFIKYENTFRLFLNLSIDFNTIVADKNTVSIWPYLTDENKNKFLSVVSHQDLIRVKDDVVSQKMFSFNQFWQTVEKNIDEILLLQPSLDSSLKKPIL